MLYGDIHAPHTYKRFLTHPVFQAALLWFRDMLPNPPPVRESKYPIFGDDMYALVQSVAEKPRQDIKFERHFKHLDFQGCFEGEETISWTPVQNLREPAGTNMEDDYQLFTSPEPYPEHSGVHLTPGRFAIFDTDDGHAPGFRCTGMVSKVVIKINRELLIRPERPQVLVIGPFEVNPGLEDSPEQAFNRLRTAGQFDSWDELVTAKGCMIQKERASKNVYLVNILQSLSDLETSSVLGEHGWQAVSPEYLLQLNVDFPDLLDHRVSIVTSQVQWKGREVLLRNRGTRIYEGLCLHNDNGMRRLRSHPCTTWGPHTWFACEKIGETI